MEKFISFIKEHKGKGIVALVLGGLAVLLMSSCLSGCSTASFSSSGDRVSDKHVKDSTHYELILEK